MQSEHADLTELAKTPYIHVLTYPRVSLRDARSRIRQLEKLGVDEVIFEGRAKIGRLGILGLGTVGIVVRAMREGSPCALKIRRIDANRPNMDEEVRITALANRVGVGPEVYGHSKDLILMKLLDFLEIGDWVRGLAGRGTRDEARYMIHSLLNQCRKLDIMGIDHGQLSNLRKHAVIAEGRPWIIDFESSGTERRPRNVTTAAQYLFVGGAVSPKLRRTLGVKDATGLRTLLSDYKRDQNDYNYSRVLEFLNLVP